MFRSNAVHNDYATDASALSAAFLHGSEPDPDALPPDANPGPELPEMDRSETRSPEGARDYVLEGSDPEDLFSRMSWVFFREPLGGVVGLSPSKRPGHLERILGHKVKSLAEKLRKLDNASYKREMRSLQHYTETSAESRNALVTRAYGIPSTRRRYRAEKEPALPCLERIWLEEYFNRRPGVAMEQGIPIPDDAAFPDTDALNHDYGPFINRAFFMQKHIPESARGGIFSRKEAIALTRARCLLQDLFMAPQMTYGEQRVLARALLAFISIIGPSVLTLTLMKYGMPLYPFLLEPEPDLDDAKWSPLFPTDHDFFAGREIMRHVLATDAGFFLPGDGLTQSAARMITAGEGLLQAQSSVGRLIVNDARTAFDHLKTCLDTGAREAGYHALEGFPWTRTRQSVEAFLERLERVNIHTPEHQEWCQKTLAPRIPSVTALTAAIEEADHTIREYRDAAETLPTLRERSQRMIAIVDDMENRITTIERDLQALLEALDPPSVPEPEIDPTLPVESGSPTIETPPDPLDTPATGSASTDPDFEHLLQENDRLNQALYDLREENHSLQVRLRTGADDHPDARLKRRVEHYLDAPDPDRALELLEALYPDRLRLLPSATGNETLDLGADAVLTKFGTVVREGYEALRDEGFGGAIRHRMPGRISARESQTVEKHEKLRAQRRFRDGDREREIFPHQSLSYTVRLYFEFDADEQRIIVGYMGKHLPNGRHATV